MSTVYSLERLRALHAVATHGSVAAAATALHVTPSGVSQQLAKLEREVGHQLLEPEGRGVRLTRAGYVLDGHAERVLSQLAEAQSDLDQLHGEIIGPLRISAFSTAARTLMPPALSTLRDKHPRLAVTLTEGEYDENLPAVLRGDLDLALIESWDNQPTPIPAGISRELLFSDMADVAISAKHRLAHRKVVAIEELDGTPWAGWTQHGACYEWLVQTLRSHHVTPTITCAVPDYDTQLALVAADLVAAVVPRLGRLPIPEGVRLMATRPPITRKIYAAWRSDSDRPAIRACVDAVSAAVQTVMA
ncbi:LysR family transcriptional regulator [Kutzneria albida]|uniref:LysR family transcription regulator n=1 Tax=Kutzneria albida DSM 43870 TaxID=1449976 RepID=W5VZ11_9PSEU|nr:LysR family transcription regulator [Kutzneria albida DSM 43870]